MQFGLNAFEVFRDHLPEPWERRPSLREKQMARPASVVKHFILWQNMALEWTVRG